MTIKAEDIGFGSSSPKTPVEQRIFRERGEQKYSLELLPAGITFEVNRLSRRSKELWGELCVLVDAQWPAAKTIEGGMLSIGDLNFSSVQARGTRAKLLSDRSRAESLDWHGFLEEFAVKILAAERQGKPGVVLADIADADDKDETWLVDGFPILQDLPMVLFGHGGSGKSYFAMYIAGQLAKAGVNVLYADWEFAVRDHRKRFGKLFQPMPKNVIYVRCDKPMVDEVERLAHLVSHHRCQYIVCDSMVFAVDGRAEDSEQAGIYFRALRSLKIGSLNIAHTTKSDDDNEKKVFGSVFFTNGARSVWFIERVNDNPPGELRFGLYHRKSNVGELLKPKGFKLVFRSEKTSVEKVNVNEVDELAAKLPLLDRMKRKLSHGALTPKGLAEACETTASIIRKMVSRHESVFIRVGDKIGLLDVSARPGEDKIDF